MKVGRYDFVQGTDVKHKNNATSAPVSPQKEAVKTAPVDFAQALKTAAQGQGGLKATAPLAATLNQVPAAAAQALAQDAGNAAQLDGLKKNLDLASASQDEKKLRKAAQEFEAIFMSMMFKSMKSTVQDGGLIEKSYARDMFEGMYLDEVGKSIASGKGTGLGQMIYKQLAQNAGTQEVATATDASTEKLKDNQLETKPVSDEKTEDKSTQGS